MNSLYLNLSQQQEFMNRCIEIKESVENEIKEQALQLPMSKLNYAQTVFKAEDLVKQGLDALAERIKSEYPSPAYADMIKLFVGTTRAQFNLSNNLRSQLENSLLAREIEIIAEPNVQTEK